MRIETRQQHHACLAELLSGLVSGQLDPTDLQGISRDIGFDFDHLNRLCRDLTGESVGAFYRRVRLEHAAQALAAGSDVGRASLIAKFESAEGFAKAFRKAYHCSPRELAQKKLDWRIASPTNIHWGDQRITPLLPGAERFGISFQVRKAIRLYGRSHIGDFGNIPSAWALLAQEISPEHRQSLEWMTIFHSDGKVQSNRDSMKAHLAYVARPNAPVLPGFAPLSLPGGAYVVSDELHGSEMHNDAWWFFNATWVPNKNAPTNHLPGFDVYGSFPEPWETLSARIYLRLAAYYESK